MMVQISAAELRTLRRQNEELQEENRQLRELLAPHIRLPRHWGLTAAQERCLMALMGRAPHVATTALLLQACTPASRWDEPLESKTVQVRICKLRQALARLVPGARIETVFGEGYKVDARSAAIIRETIARDLAGPVAEAA